MSTATPVILASASPRRRELLTRLGVPFTVVPASVDETVPEFVDDSAVFARQLAERKARAVAGRYPGAAVLAADTIVVQNGKILGKPETAVEARDTLQLLRNRLHEVTTAIALAHSSKLWLNHATTSITMRDFSDEEIDSYIATGDPFDKAGSYAIQDRQFKPVKQYDGCYCNVVGLPVVLIRRVLEEVSQTMLDSHTPDLPPECVSCPLNSSAYIDNPG